MNAGNRNTFILALADAFSRLGPEEKILLAPSNRVGRSWIDQASEVVGIVANARVMTPPRLLAELALSGLEKAGLAVPDETERFAVVAGALRERRECGQGGYFALLRPSTSVIRALDRTFFDLSGAGVLDGGAFSRHIDPPERGGELAALYARWRRGFSENRLAAPDQMAGFALSAAAAKQSAPRLLLPADLALSIAPHILRVIDAWPEGRRLILPVDGGDPSADLDFFAADGGVNEAREVFRRVLARGMPLDQVEIVAIGGGNGISSLCHAGFEAFGRRGEPMFAEDLPLTFEDGLPGYFARPTRLLSAWLDWLRGSRDSAGLAAFLRSGLAARTGKEKEAAGFERMAFALDRTPPARGIEAIVSVVSGRADREDPPAMAALQGFIGEVLAPFVPDPDVRGVFLSARALLSGWSAIGGELDAYAQGRLLEDPFVAGRAEPWPELDAFAWLAELAGGLRLLGQGPRPGKAHVSGLSGGHAGRPFAFILGLDEAAFPGGDRQDPALLDEERSRISPLLPLASEQGAKNEAGLRRLLARRRGSVTLSFARLDLGQGRDMFAADIFNELGEKSGKKTESAVFLPGGEAKRLNPGEYWLDALSGVPGAEPAFDAAAAFFPNLVSGESADRARRSSVFTEYDGFAPEAAGIPESLSPTQLETLYACPQEFFFRWILGVAPLDRDRPEAGRWLSASDKGSLLHELFHDFQRALLDRGERADPVRHGPLLESTLDDRLAHWQSVRPPENPALLDAERRDLLERARVFLHSEAENQKTSRPAYLEAAFGMEGRSAPWNGGLPAALALPSGRSVRLRGRLDRVDLADSGGYIIWDYKTGSESGFSASDPFKGGKLQAALYAMALQSLLAAEGANVLASGYFFPSPDSGGKRFLYRKGDLSRVLGVVDVLAGLLEKGVFPYGRKERRSYGFAPVFDAAGGPGRLARQTSVKAADPGNASLFAEWNELS